MNDDFYNVYKAGRDMVEMLRHEDLPEPLQDFISSIERGSNSLDKANSEYYQRWKKERKSL